MLQATTSSFPASAKLLGLLRAVQEELPDVPLYYTNAGLSRTLRCCNMKMNVLHGAVVAAGFHSSGTHCNKDGFKTDAPPEVRNLGCAHDRDGNAAVNARTKVSWQCR